MGDSRMTVLNTPRVDLRPFTPDDAPAFFRLNRNPEVVRHTGQPPLRTLAEAEHALRSAPLHDYVHHGYGRHACVLRRTGEVIGFTGLKYLPERNETDLGYRFLPEHWGQGLATESCLAVLPWAFETLRLEELIGMHEHANPASGRVLEKCGFTCSGVTEYEGHEVTLWRLRSAAWRARG